MKDFDGIANSLGIDVMFDSHSEAWMRVYNELTKGGAVTTDLPDGVPETGTNIALGIIRTLQAKAAAFDSLCEAPAFIKPAEEDFNNRMFQEGAKSVHGAVLELKSIADETLEDYDREDWAQAARRRVH